MVFHLKGYVPYLGIWVRIMKRRVRMVVVKVVVVCILKYNHFYHCYYYNPYPVLHNPNPNPQVWFGLSIISNYVSILMYKPLILGDLG